MEQHMMIFKTVRLQGQSKLYCISSVKKISINSESCLTRLIWMATETFQKMNLRPCWIKLAKITVMNSWMNSLNKLIGMVTARLILKSFCRSIRCNNNRVNLFNNRSNLKDKFKLMCLNNFRDWKWLIIKSFLTASFPSCTVSSQL